MLFLHSYTNIHVNIYIFASLYITPRYAHFHIYECKYMWAEKRCGQVVNLWYMDRTVIPVAINALPRPNFGQIESQKKIIFRHIFLVSFANNYDKGRYTFHGKMIYHINNLWNWLLESLIGQILACLFYIINLICITLLYWLPKQRPLKWLTLDICLFASLKGHRCKNSCAQIMKSKFTFT